MLPHLSHEVSPKSAALRSPGGRDRNTPAPARRQPRTSQLPHRDRAGEGDACAKRLASRGVHARVGTRPPRRAHPGVPAGVGLSEHRARTRPARPGRGRVTCMQDVDGPGTRWGHVGPRSRSPPCAPPPSTSPDTPAGTRECVQMQSSTSVHTCAHTHAHTHTHASTHTRTHMHTHTTSTHVLTRAHSHTCIHAHTHALTCTHMCTRMHSRMHTHSHTCIYTRTHTNTCAHAPTHVRTHAHTHTHVYTCTH